MQRKANCSVQSPQGSRSDQQASPLTPLQVYLKKTVFSNKSTFLKDPAAAFFSNLDNDVGLPTPLVPQSRATGQLRFEVPTNTTQQLGADLPVQKASKCLAPEVHNDRTAHERLNISRVTSSPTVCKHLQAGSIVTTAQVHVQERESSQSDQQQGTSINPSNTELLLSTNISTEVHNDIVHEGKPQQSTPISRSNLNTQGSNERLDMGFEAATGKMEDSWLQSLSITNNKDLGEALDLKTLDLMNPKDQYLNKPLLVGSTEYSSFLSQQESLLNSIMDILSDISKPQHDVVEMAKSILTICTPETINREGKKMSSKSSSQAGYPSRKMEDLNRLHASLLNALHTSTTALNMQSDNLDLQMDLMNVMAIHIADINRKLDLQATRPLEHISSQQQVFYNCGPVIDKLSMFQTILTEILQKGKTSDINEATFNNTNHDSGYKVILQKTPGLAASSPTKNEANTQGIYSISTDKSSQLKEIVSTNSECKNECPARKLKPLTTRQKMRARKARKQTSAKAVNDNLYPIFLVLQKPPTLGSGSSGNQKASNHGKVTRDGAVNGLGPSPTAASPKSAVHKMSQSTVQFQFNPHASEFRVREVLDQAPRQRCPREKNAHE
ncbi:hypothetical protein NDU88_008326 [Pleurodeles waltl]|uniref:Uncharacterized protein n=1 Tax=Pleurodeles waltl TaxID=8319 RepID=A0AAV7VX15_PLEWA|nr:hypothetical protein NDU88_008326 [Pleurodeles waltl]